jgi:hypothetical protein
MPEQTTRFRCEILQRLRIKTKIKSAQCNISKSRRKFKIELNTNIELQGGQKSKMIQPVTARVRRGNRKLGRSRMQPYRSRLIQMSAHSARTERCPLCNKSCSHSWRKSSCIEPGKSIKKTSYCTSLVNQNRVRYSRTRLHVSETFDMSRCQSMKNQRCPGDIEKFTSLESMHCYIN